MIFKRVFLEFMPIHDLQSKIYIYTIHNVHYKFLVSWKRGWHLIMEAGSLILVDIP